MLLEVLANLAIGSLSVGTAGGVLACVYYRFELKRAAKILRAEIGDRFKNNPRHLSIEMAMHLDADVDMKWWQDEFDKLVRAAVSDDWMTLSERQIHDHLPPTSAEFGRWMDYHLTVDLPSHAQALGNLLSARMITVEEARVSMSGAKAALASLKVESERCEKCEYVEEMTYASKHVKHRVTRQCERCLAEDVKEISGHWG